MPRPKVRTVVRRRPSDKIPEDPEVEVLPEEPVPEPVAPPPPTTSGAPRLEMDDLEALASMDPDALAQWMDGVQTTQKLEVGERVQGKVTRISGEEAFVDIGAKFEATMSRSELGTGAGIGDHVSAFVVGADDHGIRMSRKLSGGAAESLLEEAATSGLPVEGRVVGRNPGGYNVKVGTVRGFCPLSQIDRPPITEPESYVGSSYNFLVTEHGDGNLVLSRRALLDKQAEEMATAFWDHAEVGTTHTGTIQSIREFGAFVEINGVVGLIPGQAVHSGLRTGGHVEVRITHIDRAANRMTLAAVDAPPSPWEADALAVGTVHNGKVTREETYGVFVEVADGVRGLLHVSKLQGARPRRGDLLTVRIEGRDADRRRLELALDDGSGETGPAVPPPVDSVGFGTLGDLLGGWKPKK